VGFVGCISDSHDEIPKKTIHDKKRGVLPALLGFNPTFSPDCPHDIPIISHTTMIFGSIPIFPGG